MLFITQCEYNFQIQKVLFCVAHKQNPFAKQSVQHSQYLTTQSMAKFMIYDRSTNLAEEFKTVAVLI